MNNIISISHDFISSYILLLILDIDPYFIS